jgi:hypothetical protein
MGDASSRSFSRRRRHDGPKRMRVLFLMMLLFVASSGVAAQPAPAAMEAVTECSQISPIDGRTPILSVRVLHDGDVEFGYPTPDFWDRRGPFVYRINEFTGSDFRNASMLCEYSTSRRRPFQSVRLPIPGLLLRCESEEIPPRRPNDLPDPRNRYWCTSQVETPAR